MTSWITICDTCKREGWDAASGETDGEVFAALVEAASATEPRVEARRFSCLMGCTRACNITIQGPGKLAYSLGEFDPTEEAAEAVVQYAALHSESETGAVPYREWPQPVKGHFVSRHLPLPTDD